MVSGVNHCSINCFKFVVILNYIATVAVDLLIFCSILLQIKTVMTLCMLSHIVYGITFIEALKSNLKTNTK